MLHCRTLPLLRQECPAPCRACDRPSHVLSYIVFRSEVRTLHLCSSAVMQRIKAILTYTHTPHARAPLLHSVCAAPAPPRRAAHTPWTSRTGRARSMPATARARSGAGPCSAGRPVLKNFYTSTIFAMADLERPSLRLKRVPRHPYRSIVFAGAAHSSITREDRPPSPTGVTLCRFSEWKSRASPD